MVKTSVIGVRLTPEQLDAIDSLISLGEFEDRSDFIKYAVRKYLRSYAGRSPPMDGGS